MVDMAHPAGLIAAGLLNNPVKYAHIVTSTTHKTLRGPRGGVILMGEDFENPWGVKTPKGETKMMSAMLDSAVFPGMQGGPLMHVIAAKAVCFKEALEPNFKTYMKNGVISYTIPSLSSDKKSLVTSRHQSILQQNVDNWSREVDVFNRELREVYIPKLLKIN